MFAYHCTCAAGYGLRPGSQLFTCHQELLKKDHDEKRRRQDSLLDDKRRYLRIGSSPAGKTLIDLGSSPAGKTESEAIQPVQSVCSQCRWLTNV